MITDIIVLVTVAVFAISGLRKGFISSVMNLITVAVAVVSAWTFFPLVSSMFVEFFTGELQTAVENTIGTFIHESISDSLSSLISQRPQAFTDILDRFHIEIGSLEQILYSLSSSDEAELYSEISKSIVTPVAQALSNITAFLAIFFGVIIVLKVATLILNIFFELPGLNTINRIGGLLLGIICGIMTAVVLVLMIDASIPVLSSIFPNIFNENSQQSSLCIRFIDGLESVSEIFSNFNSMFAIKK